MQEMTGARHGDLLQHESADSVDSVKPPFGRLFWRSKSVISDAALEAVADAMNWIDQATDPSGDSSIPAGYTVLGQFITHDLSFNTTPLGDSPRRGSPDAGKRTPKFDLDSIYSPSPLFGISPPIDRETGKMWYRKAEGPDEADDLPRWIDVKESQDYDGLRMPDGSPIPDHQAIIGDIRNDENVLIAQLHLAFLKLHNRFVDYIREHELDGKSKTSSELFTEARQLCQRYYQWVVVEDFLPRIVGQDTIDSVMTKRGNVRPELRLTLYEHSKIRPPIIPIEFTAAAFRFGHSMIRAVYRVNAAGTQFPLFGRSEQDERHLGGSRRLSKALVIDWARFFDDLAPSTSLADDRTFARNKARKIDSFLNELLTRLPPGAIPEQGGRGERSLVLRDLQRGVDLELPSGQEVAREVSARLGSHFPILSYDLGLYDLGVDVQAPLWFYLLKEAELIGRGEQLGPVGGRIVAEVILGLMACDEHSYFTTCPDFAPTGPSGKPFVMADLLRIAGVAR